MYLRTKRLPRSGRRLLAVAAVLAIAATGLTLTAGTPAAGGRPPEGHLSWTPCPSVPEPSQGLECTTVTVPLDYSRPAGETINIAVSRLPSSRPSQRRGVLLLDIGGQGDSQAALPLTLVSLGLP